MFLSIIIQVRDVCLKWMCVYECFGGCLDVFRGDGPLTLVVFGIGDQTALLSSVFVSANLLFCVRIACDVVLESFAFVISSSSQWLVWSELRCLMIGVFERRASWRSSCCRPIPSSKPSATPRPSRTTTLLDS